MCHSNKILKMTQLSLITEKKETIGKEEEDEKEKASISIKKSKPWLYLFH